MKEYVLIALAALALSHFFVQPILDSLNHTVARSVFKIETGGKP